MLYSKKISVSASMRNEVTQRVGNEIEDMKNSAGKNNISKSSAVKSAGAKTAVISHKAVAIVAACVVAATEIPLIKNLSEMDSEYTQLMYIGIGRNEDSTSWEYEYDKTDIPGFTNFYE